MTSPLPHVLLCDGSACARGVPAVRQICFVVDAGQADERPAHRLACPAQTCVEDALALAEAEARYSYVETLWLPHIPHSVQTSQHYRSGHGVAGCTVCQWWVSYDPYSGTAWTTRAHELHVTALLNPQVGEPGPVEAAAARFAAKNNQGLGRTA